MIFGAFPEWRRALAQAVFAAGMLLGGASGLALCGIIGPRYGWQAALFVVAVLGIFPGLALVRLEDPPRGPRSEVVPMLRLLSVPACVSLIAAGIRITFSTVSLSSWVGGFTVTHRYLRPREAACLLC